MPKYIMKNCRSQKIDGGFEYHIFNAAMDKVDTIHAMADEAKELQLEAISPAQWYMRKGAKK